MRFRDRGTGRSVDLSARRERVGRRGEQELVGSGAEQMDPMKPRRWRSPGTPQVAKSDREVSVASFRTVRSTLPFKLPFVGVPTVRVVNPRAARDLGPGDCRTRVEPLFSVEAMVAGYEGVSRAALAEAAVRLIRHRDRLQAGVMNTPDRQIVAIPGRNDIS